MRNKFFVASVSIPFLARTYNYVAPESVLEDGRVVQKLTIHSDIVSERDKGVNPLDFALENLLANDVELKDMSMNNDLFVAHDDLLYYLSDSLKSVDNGQS